jgi:VWFA-related protein
MSNLFPRWALLSLVLLSADGAAQVINIPTAGDRFAPLDAMQTSRMDLNLLLIGSRDSRTTDLQSPSGSISRLDLKAPGKARHEYDEGYQLLMRKDLQGAVEHLAKSIAIYQKFVAAHNALGTAYLDLGQTELALSEFTDSVALDDHLPNSYLNLGCADLALKQYAAAEASMRKASSIAPLDLQLQLALAYAEFMNQDYSAVLATSSQVHARKHEGAALVHFFAAGALEAQGDFGKAQHEMETLLAEDANSAVAGQFRQILQQIRREQERRAEAELQPAQTVTFVAEAREPSSEEVARHQQFVSQQEKEEKEIAEAEEPPDAACVDCGTAGPVESLPISGSGLKQSGHSVPGATFRVNADEVSVFFAATDHGQSVTDLAASDVDIRDNSQPPSAILGFRNETQLPLRLGLVVDTSESVGDRFSFEQAAATRFLKDVVVDKDDLAFVVGVNNSVLLVQDFTNDQTMISQAINLLAPGGGTALWDAVAFAADKLASHPEVQPVARILIVISDGQDNSSSVTLKQAIASAQRGEVAVYTVSSREELREDSSALVGDHALRALAELTGGTAFMPVSVRSLNQSFGALQQVIRSRYLVSYRPASFQRDDRYRTIDISAQKGGRKLKVFTRKGYYASAVPPG